MENRVFFLQTSQNQNLSVAAYSLLEYAVGKKLAIARTEHGKPYFPDYPQLHFSLSHTRGAVVCALSKHPVGVDVEHARPVRLALAARFFTPAEQAYAVDAERFLQVWTRKEALLKWEGKGLSSLFKIETMGHEKLTTREVNGFTISFCGTPPEYELVRVHWKDVLSSVP